MDYGVSETNIDEWVCKVQGETFMWVMEDPNDQKFRCFLINFAMTLYEINFGYICSAFSILIIFISLFGGIKENYRWFILNQAIWDLFVTYDYFCTNEILSFMSHQFTDNTCFWWDFNSYVKGFLHKMIETNPYSSLLLLSITRFLCLYFMNFYERLTRGKRILFFILIFNFLTIFFHFNYYFNYLRDYDDFERICYFYPKKKVCKTFKWKFLGTIDRIFKVAGNLKPLICLLLSVFGAIMIIIKISKQAAFQIKHNPRDFMNSLRVTLVIVLQIIINTLLFILEFNIAWNEIYVALDLHFESLNDFPSWFDAQYGLTDSNIVFTLRQCRIFLEAIIVLSIMTGYREAIIGFFKFCFTTIKNPKKAYEKSISSISRTKVSMMR